ncbi:hypothetical protein ACIRFH_34845 [Streptomyces sp. NPDC093586]|uniref:CurL C-terminal domain-containing protein n=1 Tax=Streptomyces sp. NPDC093586 TaxID=3366042 RepID=UPI003827C42F
MTTTVTSAVDGAVDSAARDDGARFPALPGVARVLGVSARDEEAAARACVRLAERLERDASLAVDDVAVTLAHGRERFAVRHAVTGTGRAELAAALRRSAALARPRRGRGPLVLDLGDGQALAGTPRLPQVAAALEEAGALGLPPGTDAYAARTAAVLYGVGAWLADRGLRPDLVRGRGPAAAAAAAALDGSLPLPDALRAAASKASGGPGGSGAAAQAVPPGLVVRLGVRSGAADERAAAASPTAARPADGPSRGGDDTAGAAAADGDTTALLAAAAGTVGGGFAPAVVSVASVLGRAGQRETAGNRVELWLDPARPASYPELFARLWELGEDVDCSLGAAGRRVRLPGYPFRRGGPAAVPPDGLRPLTPYEQRRLFHDLVRSGSAAENVLCATAVLPGPAPSPAQADAALAALRERHPALRTVFTRHAGRWFARTSQEPVPVTVLAPGDVPGEPAARVRAAAADESFATADAPLVRCALAPADGPGGRWAVALAVYAPVAGDASPDALLDEWARLAGPAA